MKLIALKPIRETREEYDRIEKKIRELFRTEVYRPLMLEIGGHSKLIQNAVDDLAAAIRKGRVTFNRGKFRGNFGSVLSKELRALGAQWNKQTSSFDISKGKLPDQIRHAVDAAYQRFLETAGRIDKKLSEVLPEDIAEKLKIEHIFDTTIYKVDGEFRKSVKAITVAPQLSASATKRISEEYNESMKLKIQGWLREEILELRGKVKEQAFKGFRYESLAKTIQDSYRVSEKKAKFLARQETNLFLGKFKETRYADAGVYEYKWKCVAGSPNHPVRPRHQELNNESAKGRIFRFDDPPVSTGAGEPPRKCNPGEDFGCRCVAIPVVRFT